MSAQSLSRIAAFLGVTTDYLLGIVDEYGLTDNDWSMMGSTYKGFRVAAKASIKQAVDGEVLTEDQLRAFEESGSPLTLAQIDTACGLIGKTGPDVFAPWSKNLYKEELPPIVGEQFDVNSLEYAAHKYAGQITDEDKQTIIRMMRMFAQSKEEGGENG